MAIYRDSAGFAQEPPASGSQSAPILTGELDTQGNPVPTYRQHIFTYDGSGNLVTDTVTDGASTWVRSYTYTPSGPETDSGWVKQ